MSRGKKTSHRASDDACDDSMWHAVLPTLMLRGVWASGDTIHSQFLLLLVIMMSSSLPFLFAMFSIFHDATAFTLPPGAVRIARAISSPIRLGAKHARFYRND